MRLREILGIGIRTDKESENLGEEKAILLEEILERTDLGRIRSVNGPIIPAPVPITPRQSSVKPSDDEAKLQERRKRRSGKKER